MKIKTRIGATAATLLLALLALPAAAGSRKARDFEYPDVNPRSPTHGQQIRLSEVYGTEGVVLNFIASWCGPCWRELPSFQKLHEEASTPVVCIAADEHGPAEDLLALADRVELDLPILLVPANEIEKMEEFWDHSMLPSTYLIDPEGQIRQVFQGMVREDTLFRAAGHYFPESGVKAPPAPSREGAIRQ